MGETLRANSKPFLPSFKAWPVTSRDIFPPITEIYNAIPFKSIISSFFPSLSIDRLSWDQDRGIWISHELVNFISRVC